LFWIHTISSQQNWFPANKVAFGFGSTKCHSNKIQFPAKSCFWFWIHKCCSNLIQFTAKSNLTLTFLNQLFGYGSTKCHPAKFHVCRKCTVNCSCVIYQNFWMFFKWIQFVRQFKNTPFMRIAIFLEEINANNIKGTLTLIHASIGVVFYITAVSISISCWGITATKWDKELSSNPWQEYQIEQIKYKNFVIGSRHDANYQKPNLWDQDWNVLSEIKNN
jgi:hypothetical protein